MINYKASDFFMTRVPLLPIDDYMRLFSDQSQQNELLVDAFDNPVLREALAVASKDLLEAIDNNRLGDNPKAAEQVCSSLLRYFIRLSTRPTPFGLFSGISIGRFGDESNITVSDSKHHTKRARPDMEWIYGLIKKIEAEKDIREKLRVRFNATLSSQVQQLGLKRLNRRNPTKAFARSIVNEM